MFIYVIRQKTVRNFIFLWDQPIKKPNNSIDKKQLFLSAELKASVEKQW
jgi:hypothetical protein